jgi:hypothetical protein
MAKKKTVGPDTPVEQTPAATRRRSTTGPRNRATIRPDPAVAEPAATPTAEPLDRAADRSVGSDSVAARQPTYNEIAEAAYQRYLERGGHDGQDFDDWVEAERSLRSRR